MDGKARKTKAEKAGRRETAETGRRTDEEEEIAEEIKEETKPEKMRREENEKMKAGRQAMRYRLWRQRREKDGRLVDIWKETKKILENSSQEEDDPWLEELDLTDEERSALQDLEK